MSTEKKSGGISRRGFLKGMGTTIAGSYVLVPGVTEAAEKVGKKIQESIGKEQLVIKINGKEFRRMVEPRMTLAEFLREELNLTGTKVVCNHGECGGCTVLLNGKAVYSCHMLALDAAGKEVTTIEGLMTGEKLHPVQEAFIEHDGLQCGFCTPGQVMAAQALLIKHPKPTREQVLDGMSGNLCRCAAYPNIIESVIAAAEKK